jgi:aspartate/methionine/tyrosine aminotransferase
MTGWRLGWMVVPPDYVQDVDKLAQNLFLAAPTMAQHAAIAAFSDENITILETRRQEFRKRRDFLLPALRELGFDIPVTPDGAFYLYADCSRFSEDSYAFSIQLLEEAGVAITPGVDFGSNQPERHVRFAYTTSLENLREGVRRLAEYLL